MRSGMALVLKASHSFTCTPRVHPLTEWTIPALAFPVSLHMIISSGTWGSQRSDSHTQNANRPTTGLRHKFFFEMGDTAALVPVPWTLAAVRGAGYSDHVDCLADVQERDDGEKLDCFGIYPQVLRLAGDWVLVEKRPNNRKKMPKETQADLIYWGWNQHLYVFLYILIGHIRSRFHILVKQRSLAPRPQGRIIHCAGCTMGGPPVVRGSRRSAANFLPRCFDVWTFSVCLNVTTTKKGHQLFWEKSAPPASRTRKGPPLYVGMGPPEWLIRPCPSRQILSTNSFSS